MLTPAGKRWWEKSREGKIIIDRPSSLDSYHLPHSPTLTKSLLVDCRYISFLAQSSSMKPRKRKENLQPNQNMSLRNLRNRLLKRGIHTSCPSAEYIAQGPSATGRSAHLAANSANSYVTADQLAEHLGDDIDLFSLGSVSEADHERQVQLKRVGERWSNSRVDVGRKGEWRWYVMCCRRRRDSSSP